MHYFQKKGAMANKLKQNKTIVPQSSDQTSTS